MAHKKVNLPQKTCPVCQRPFTWRKKWEKDWEQVIYCSERCRRGKYRDEQIYRTIFKWMIVFLIMFNINNSAKKYDYRYKQKTVT